MTDEGLENKCMQEHYTKAEHSRVLHMCMGLFTNEVTITQSSAVPATTTSHVHMCVTFVLEQYCVSNSTSKYHIYAYHSMFNFQYLNYVVHNSPLGNQVSVPVSFWHPPELQHIYPIRCKLLTCCYRGCSCYGSVLWLL